MPHTLITYSIHARQRMKQRSVSEAAIATTLHNADHVYLGSHGNPIAERRFDDGRILMVVFADLLGPQGEHTHIITAMWK